MLLRGSHILGDGENDAELIGVEDWEFGSLLQKREPATRGVLRCVI